MEEPDNGDATIRKVVGLVLRAAERGETETLLASIVDDANRSFVTELAQYADQKRVLTPISPVSGELDQLYPTSGELLLEEEFEESLTLTDPLEAELLLSIAKTKDEGVRRIWERTLIMLAEERDGDTES